MASRSAITLREAVNDDPFVDPQRAGRYDEWYAGPGHHADQLEKRLLEKLLARFSDARTILEIGCGTGHFCRWFAELGYAVVGLDRSPAMLAEAHRRDRVQYVEADAHRLPYVDRAFDVAALITTLEFVADPQLVLREAARVARRGLLLGILNRCSLLAWQYRRSGKPVWRQATFFSVSELKRLIRNASDDRLVAIHWSTTLWPLRFVGDLRLPWGGFIGMAAEFRRSD